MILLAQVESPLLKSPESAITQPRESSPTGNQGKQGPGRIYSPFQGGSSDNVESDEDRKRRLIEAGVLAAPKVIVKKSAIDKIVEKFAAETKDSQGTPVPVSSRVEMNFGSWETFRAPKNSLFIEDFSYGFRSLFKLRAEPIPEVGWGNTLLVGPSVTFYNAGLFQKIVDIYGEISPLYVDYNSTEAGLDVTVMQEQRVSENLTSAYEFGASYQPFRWVRTRYDSMSEPKPRTEARSHFRVSWAGVGFTGGVSLTMARTVGVGAFVSLNAATPFQIRSRIGISIFMLSKDAAKEEAKDAKSEPQSEVNSNAKAKPKMDSKPDAKLDQP